MPQEPRKATDVLLEIESSVKLCLNIIQAQDLNIKILSNKLTDVMKSLEKQSTVVPPKMTIEAANVINTSQAASMMSAALSQPFNPEDAERRIPIIAERNLPLEDSPNGFRRNSRPETFAGDNAYLNNSQEMKMPMQLLKQPAAPSQQQKPPPGRTASPDPVIVAPNQKPQRQLQGQPQRQVELPVENIEQAPRSGQIPIMQRCVDKGGKSVFLADVEIFDKDSMEQIFKTRTNGTGKWMASLGIGTYRVVIKKRISVSKEQMEAVQDINVDGMQSPLELPMMIIK